MQKSSTAQTPTQNTQAARGSDKIHPALQNVLVGLDVQLEEELVRYRRQRALGKTSYKPINPSFHKISKALKSVSGSTAPISLPTIAGAVPVSDSPSEFHPTIDLPPFAEISQPSSNLVAETPEEITLDAYTANEGAPEIEAIDSNRTIEESHASVTSATELRELARQYASHVADSSDLTLSSRGAPDDYLESSEELLRALSREEAEVQAEQSFMHSLLTPLGFGSMLLLLLSSAMFGFVITNPSSVSQLFADQKTSAPTDPVDPSIATPAAPQTSNLPQPNLANQEFPELSVATLGTIKIDQATPLTPAANGATKAPAPSALVNIGLSGTTATTPSSPLTTVSPANQVNAGMPPAKAPAGDIPSPRRLAPGVGNSTAPRSNPAPAPRSYNPAPPSRSYDAPARRDSPAPVRAPSPPPQAYRPQPIPPFQPAPRRNSVTPPVPSSDRTSLPAAPPLSSSVTSGGGSSAYKVVSPYTSDRVLEDARQQVPDAYVKNYPDGAKVQFGAYSDEAAAKAQVEALKQQGIPAEVYKP